MNFIISSFIKGYETFDLIAEKYPDQLLTVPQDQTTILHIAVARQDFKGNYYKNSVFIAIMNIP